MNTKKQIKKELEGKKPFIEIRPPNKPKVMIYEVKGTYLILSDYSGIIPLNGNIEQVSQAVQQGELEGIIRSFDSAEFLIPQFDSNYRTYGLMRTSQADYWLTHYDPERKNKDGTLKENRPKEEIMAETKKLYR